MCDVCELYLHHKSHLKASYVGLYDVLFRRFPSISHRYTYTKTHGLRRSKSTLRSVPRSYCCWIPIARGPRGRTGLRRPWFLLFSSGFALCDPPPAGALSLLGEHTVGLSLI